MVYTCIFLCQSIEDYAFGSRLQDDLSQILGENGIVFPITGPALFTQGDSLYLPNDLREKNPRQIFMVILSPNTVASAWVNGEIEKACRRKDDPDPAKKVGVMPVLYRPCQVPLSLEKLQVFSLLPPKSYEAAFQEILMALDLSSQAVSPLPSVASTEDQRPLTPSKPLATKPDAIKLARVLTDHIDKVSAVTLSSNGQMLASGSRDMRIKLWNTQTGGLLHTLNGHTDTVFSLTLSADGRLLASASEDNTAKLWNTQTGQVLHTFTIPTPKIFYSNEIPITLSADGLTLAVMEKKAWERMIQLWDLRRGKLLHSLKSDPGCMALSADGQTLICGSGKNICLWNIRKGKQIRTLSGHTESVQSVTISADGRMIASGSRDKTIKLWNPKTGQLLQTLSGHTNTVHSLAMSADGRTLASGSDNEIHLWDAQTGQLLRTLNVKKTDIHTRVMNKVPKTIKCHTESIQCVAMSADGSTLVSGDQEGIVIAWGVIE